MIRDYQAALLAMYAEQMFADPLVQEPPLHPNMSPLWNLVGYLTATDALFRREQAVLGRVLRAVGLGTRRVFYGMLVRSKVNVGEYACIVRGTDGAVEWAIDAEGLQRKHPIAGLVEDGFWGVYSSMSYRDPGGSDAPLMGSLQRRISTGRCTVIGHSLGAAIATYLACDLSEFLLAGRIALRAVASPHPGDSAFADLVNFRVPDHTSFWYEPDRVPQVPPSLPGLSYSALPNRKVYPASPEVTDNGFCPHHALCYAWLEGGADALAEAGSAADPYLSCLPGG